MVSNYGSLWVLFVYICISLCWVYIPCAFSLFYPLFILFSYALIVIYLFVFKEREKEGMKLDRYEAWKDLEGDKGEEIVIRTYWMEKINLNKKINAFTAMYYFIAHFWWQILLTLYAIAIPLLLTFFTGRMPFCLEVYSLKKCNPRDRKYL